MSPDESDPNDARLRALGDALRAMRRGEFRLALPDTAPGAPSAAVAALEHEIAQLAVWLDQRFGEFERLRTMAEEVTQGLFVDDVLDRVFDTFRPLIPYNRIGCALLSDDGSTVVSRWARSDYPELKLRRGYTAHLAETSLGEVLASGRPRILNDLEAYLTANPGSVSTRLAVGEGIRSSLTCPLVARGTPLGFLFFSSFETGTYRDAHQSLFMYIAGQLASLLDRSRLYQEVFELHEQLAEAHRTLQEQSMRDALTGCFNRGAICEMLATELLRAGRHQEPLAVIMADIDHFKRINDTLGHQSGDRVLGAVAQAIQGAVREYDRVGRYGGEEFLVVLPAAGLDEAVRVAERVREAVASLALDGADAPLRVSASLGVAATATGVPTTLDALVAVADQRLYAAKRAGRNRVGGSD